MGFPICAGALLQCTFGVAPSALGVLPANRTMCGGPPATNIMDNVPFMNIMPFGMCSSPANPAVAAATAAALGVLTPMPCTPVPAGPWIPGAPTALIANMPTVTDASKLMCSFGGVISVTVAGEFQSMA